MEEIKHLPPGVGMLTTQESKVLGATPPAACERAGHFPMPGRIPLGRCSSLCCLQRPAKFGFIPKHHSWIPSGRTGLLFYYLSRLLTFFYGRVSNQCCFWGSLPLGPSSDSCQSRAHAHTRPCLRPTEQGEEFPGSSQANSFALWLSPCQGLTW